MTTDLDTLLIALYVFCDDHLTPAERKRPGRRKKLSDAELLCLAVAQVMLGFPSQHHWLIDVTPLPCGTSRETVNAPSWPGGWANYGYGASHSRYYWGLKLYLVTTLEGMPVVWCLADPNSANARSPPNCSPAPAT